MIKLLHNPNTKVISTYEINEEELEEQEKIKKQEEQNKKKIIQLKLFFEKYKIFFEIFSTVLLGIMSLIISFVSWKTNERSVDIYQKQLEIYQAQLEIQQAQSDIQQVQSDIYQKQLEIQANDREPHFTISCKPITEKDNSLKCYYIIKNEGGKINMGSIWYIDTFLTIYFLENDYNTYYYRINNAFFFDHRELSLYDNDNKEFVFSGYDYPIFYQLKENLEAKLKSIYDTENISVVFNSYFTMRFTNYKNEQYINTYKFTAHSIEFVNNDYNDEKNYLDTIDFDTDISSIVYKISEKIDEFQNNIIP